MHGIGKNNQLPWKIPKELEHFKQMTTNKIVVMGYNTYKSIGKLLPNRTNIILTRHHKNNVEQGALTYQTAKSILKDFQNVDIYIIGGKLVYESFWPYADELIVSRLDHDYKCDVTFNPDLSDFKLFDEKKHKDFTIFFYRKKDNLNIKSSLSTFEENNVFNLNFKHFVGPFDLLLNLIQEKKMDILNLDLSLLASQYLDYIKKNMKNIDIEQTTDYLVMATYLIELKSKQIISKNSTEDKEDYDLFDNKERDRLVKHLIEYKHYREVLPELEKMQIDRFDMLGKESDSWESFQATNDTLIEAPLPNYVNPNTLINAMQRVFKRLQSKIINSPKIVIQELSIEEVQDEVFDIIKNSKLKQISLTELLNQVNPNKISQMYFVTCFVALLVLTRYQKIDMFQKKVNDEIYIELNTRVQSDEPEETIEEMIKRQEDFKRETEEYKKEILKRRAEEYRKKREDYLKAKYGDAYVSPDQYKKMSQEEKEKLKHKRIEIDTKLKKNSDGE